MHHLKRIPLLLSALLLTLVLPAQHRNFRLIDRHALSAPPSAATSVASLAGYLAEPAGSDFEKARAFYTWITHNIRYNDSLANSSLLGTIENERLQQADRVLANRSGVCEGFANLFEALCKEVGLKAAVVAGKVKDERGVVERIAHAWNAVELDGEWYLSDPTWGAGPSDSPAAAYGSEFREYFFLPAPSDLLKDHFPHDPVWQLRERPVTFALWSGDPSASLELPEPVFSFRDTIRQWWAQDSVQRLYSSCRRILRYNPANGYAWVTMGNTSYNLAVEIFDRTERQINDDKSRTLRDTSYFLAQISRIGTLFAEADHYYRSVDPSWVSDDWQKPAMDEAFARIDILRGNFRYWVMGRYGLDEGVGADNFATLKRNVEAAYQAGQQALGYFRQVQAFFKRKNPLDTDYLPALCDELTLTTWTLGANELYVAQADPDMDDARLRWTLGLLDRAERSFRQALETMSCGTVLGPRTKELSLEELYPGVMAELYNLRGRTQGILLEREFATYWKNPAALTAAKAEEISGKYLACDNWFAKGLEFLQTFPGEGKDELHRALWTGRSMFHLTAGDVFNNLLAAESQKSNGSPSPTQKTAFLKWSDRAYRYYNSALGFLNSGKIPAAELRGQIRERIGRIEKLQTALGK